MNELIAAAAAAKFKACERICCLEASIAYEWQGNNSVDVVQVAADAPRFSDSFPHSFA